MLKQLQILITIVMKIKESTLLDNTFVLNATFSKSGIIFAGMGLFFKIICFFKN